MAVCSDMFDVTIAVSSAYVATSTLAEGILGDGTGISAVQKVQVHFLVERLRPRTGALILYKSPSCHILSKAFLTSE